MKEAHQESRRLHRVPAAAGALWLALVAGCAANDRASPDDRDSPQEGHPRRVFGRSVEGRAISGSVVGSGPETYLLLGVIHGNEAQGGPLLDRFEQYAGRHPEALHGKQLVVIPVLNPDGLARGTRTNARGVDLNRNFPARSWQPGRRHGQSPASEAETRTLLRIIRQFSPTRILSIHSPLHCINFDGPAEGLASGMARASGYPLRASIGYPTPGSLGSYAGMDLDIPIITLELPPGLIAERLWAELGPALERFVQHQEVRREGG